MTTMTKDYLVMYLLFATLFVAGLMLIYCRQIHSSTIILSSTLFGMAVMVAWWLST
jgi:hypothetical protein